MYRWIWFKKLQLEDFLGPEPQRDGDGGAAETRPDGRARQAEALALRRLGRAPS